jgi:hypothetical protein
MRGLVDTLVKSTDSPRAAITTEGRTLGTTTSVGDAGATVCFSLSNPICLVYTDPDGNSDTDAEEQRSWTSIENYSYWVDQINDITNENNVLRSEIDVLKNIDIDRLVLGELFRSGVIGDYFKNAIDNILTLGIDLTIAKAGGAGSLVDPTIVPDVYSVFGNSENIISTIGRGIQITNDIKNEIRKGIAIRESKIKTNDELLLYLKDKVNTHYCYTNNGQKQSLKF